MRCDAPDEGAWDRAWIACHISWIAAGSRVRTPDQSYPWSRTNPRLGVGCDVEDLARLIATGLPRLVDLDEHRSDVAMVARLRLRSAAVVDVVLFPMDRERRSVEVVEEIATGCE